MGRQWASGCVLSTCCAPPALPATHGVSKIIIHTRCRDKQELARRSVQGANFVVARLPFSFTGDAYGRLNGWVGETAHERKGGWDDGWMGSLVGSGWHPSGGVGWGGD